jgi:hypothetical protein
MSKFKVDNKLALTALSALFGAGAFVVDVLSKKSEQNEVAEKAAKIVMKNMSKNKD